VLRALHEAGVKLDIVAGRGVGCVGALFAAIDGAHRLWDDRGLWRAANVRTLYPWRRPLRIAAATLAIAVVLVAVPLVAMAAGLVVFPIDFVLKMLGATGTGGLTAWYLDLAARAFAPTGFPTWLPRLVLLALGMAASIVAVTAYWRKNARAMRGPVWWRMVPEPLSANAAVEHCWRVLWDLLRGATALKSPARVDLARRYAEMLSENLGQPGYLELLLVAHDLDAGRDLVFALTAESRRRQLLRATAFDTLENRRAEVVDLVGNGRDHLPDAIAAALSVPLATSSHVIRFAPESYWRGEAHRLTDRPGSLERLVAELAALDVDQIILVSACAEAARPHGLVSPRLEGRSRIGEYLRSSESAAVRDVLASRADPGAVPQIFVIRPAHNPVGPFDFDGGFDDQSGRASTLSELMNRGYEDAYRQFIEPIVGASGERVGQSIEPNNRTV
jgi:hypothetical protein